MPTISVIIPVYNVEPFLRRCLDSLLDQTYTDWEAICVNDGSPDNSQAILEEYAKKDSRFIILVQKNKGLSEARNTGMRSARGDYLIFLDSDDFIHPQTLEIALSLATKEHADLVTWYKDPLFRALVFLRHFTGLPTASYRPSSYKKTFDLNDIDYHVTLDMSSHLTEIKTKEIKHQIRHFYVWRFLVKRRLAEDIKFVPRLLFEDFPWSSELVLKNPKVVITQLPFYYYQPNFNSILTSTGNKTKVMNWIRGLNHILPIYDKKASQAQRKNWERYCLWPVLGNQIMRKRKVFEDDKQILKELQTLQNKGVFDNPQTPHFKKLQQELLRLLQESLLQ